MDKSTNYDPRNSVASADYDASQGLDERQPLPDCPEVALFIASLFQRLGGSLFAETGGLGAVIPEPIAFRMQGKQLPQMADAMPHEEFHSAGEWRGAMKLAHYWLSRLSAADQEFVATLFASVSTEANFDYRDFLQA